jgi:hypothetical protein
MTWANNFFVLANFGLPGIANLQMIWPQKLSDQFLSAYLCVSVEYWYFLDALRADAK